MPEIPPTSDDREYQGEFSNTTTDELREIVKQGINIGIETSKAAKAKRELDDRIQQHELKAIKNIETVTHQLQMSHTELLNIVSILAFFKKHWLPKQSIWIRILVFLVLTVGLGILLNIAANGITLYWLHWR